jgi:hypothetical protein
MGVNRIYTESIDLCGTICSYFDSNSVMNASYISLLAMTIFNQVHVEHHIIGTETAPGVRPLWPQCSQLILNARQLPVPSLITSAGRHFPSSASTPQKLQYHHRGAKPPLIVHNHILK